MLAYYMKPSHGDIAQWRADIGTVSCNGPIHMPYPMKERIVKLRDEIAARIHSTH
jgi:hypothetical protein